MKYPALVTLAVLPLLFLAADSGPSHFNVHIEGLENIAREPIVRAPKSFPLELHDFEYNDRKRLIQFNKETGETWQYFELIDTNKHIEPGWRSVMYYGVTNVKSHPKISTEEFLMDTNIPASALDN